MVISHHKYGWVKNNSEEVFHIISVDYKTAEFLSFCKQPFDGQILEHSWFIADYHFYGLQLITDLSWSSSIMNGDSYAKPRSVLFSFPFQDHDG